MLIVETIARIRREHFIKGKTIKEIAPDRKVSRNTVRKVLRSGETSFEYERVVHFRRQGEDCARASVRSIRRLAFRARMGQAAVASARRTHFQADQSRSRDGTAPQFVTVLPLRGSGLQGLQNANPHQSSGEKDRGTRLGGHPTSLGLFDNVAH